MASDDLIRREGVVTSSSRDIFTVVCKEGETEQIVTATPSGKLRRNKIRILVGDTVTVEVSPYDLTKGRISHRGKR